MIGIIETISLGGMDVRIPKVIMESNDEIGKLAQSIDRILVSLKLSIRRNQPKAQPIKSLSEDVLLK